MSDHPRTNDESRCGIAALRARAAIRYACTSFALLAMAGSGADCSMDDTTHQTPGAGGTSAASGSTSSTGTGSTSSVSTSSGGSAGSIGSGVTNSSSSNSSSTGGSASGGGSNSGGSAGSSSGGGTSDGGGSSTAGSSSDGGADAAAIDSGGLFETDGSLPKNQWVQVFNHKDLSHFHALIHGWTYDDNHYNTFRVDPATGYLVNSLADYPGGAKGYGGHCGLLYVDRYLTDYRLRIEYHFLPNGDGNNNGGMEVFCQDPAQVTGDPMYAPGLEIQVIAQCTNGCGGGATKAGDGSNNLSICQPTPVKASTVMGNPTAGTTNCTPGSYAQLPTASQWVTIECEIHPNSVSKCWNCLENAPTPSTAFPGCTPDIAQRPDITFSGVHDGSGMLKGGYFAPIQSEAQEQEYRTIEIMDLSP